MEIKKIIKIIVIPVALFLLWFIAGMLYSSKISFSTLSYKESLKELTVKDKKIIGNFVAKDNNLGIIMLRYVAYVKKGTDPLIFRIKEKGQENWYATVNYQSGLIQNNSLFTFGFPLIANSKGKEYIFELFSKNNEVKIDRFGFYTEYSFNKPKSHFIEFALKKTITSLSDLEFILSSLLFGIPFIGYLFILFLNNYKLSKNRLVSFMSIFIFIDLLITDFYLGVFSLIAFFWIYSIYRFKIQYRYNFLIALSLIVFWLILTFLKSGLFLDKLNIWVYFFLATGIFQLFAEELYEKK